MARSPRTVNAPTAAIPPSTTTATATTNTTTTPSTPLILAPSDASGSKHKPLVEAKTHALRSVLGEKERTPCPFPGQYGGNERCGVVEEDERDEVLMAACAACASMENRALSSDEIAVIAIDQAWLRAPSAAVIPSTIINNAIRAHHKRCATSTPPRPSLLAKHQLAGSVNEMGLESALHPDAYTGTSRPKGTVWYLAPVGKTKWKNPFAGLNIPKPLPKKPEPTKKLQKELKAKPSPALYSDKKLKGKSKLVSGSGNVGGAGSAAAPVKIRLVLNGQHPNGEEDEEASEAGSSSQGSRNVSRRRSLTPLGISKPLPLASKRGARKVKNILDSSDESDTSDSELEFEPFDSSNLLRSTVKPTKGRKDRPPPLPLSTSHSSRSGIPPLLSRSLGSPFFDWGTGVLCPSPTFPTNMLSQPHSSPFPSHSLDNTTWAVRHDPDRFAAFETSSSSSDEDMREPDWGTGSGTGIMIRGSEAGEDGKPIWTVEDEETKVKEATDALRVLFPMSTPDEEVEIQPQIQLNQLDNRPGTSDTSSLAESTSATVTSARGAKSADLAASIALAAWTGMSSPAPSPNLKTYSHFGFDASPTQHLSKLHNSFEAGEMEVDDEPWLDESGELPVKAEDTFSDIDLGSTIGDVATPEHDRQLHTAAWAREAAANTHFRVKEEPEDYPSPLTTEPDDVSATGYRGSRASSSDSHTPSSRSSELPPFEMYTERMFRPDLEEVLMGPESVSMEELDGWLPGMGRTEKTPQRVRHGKSRHHRNDGPRRTGNWGGIGVGMGTGSPFVRDLGIRTTPIAPTRQRSTRSSARRRRSSPRPPQLSRTGIESLLTPPTDTERDDAEPDMAQVSETGDIEVDAIGPADLEAARAEADESEEQHRRACREKVEQQRALLEAYRQRVQEEHVRGSSSTNEGTPEGWEGVSPWSDLNSGPWGSSDSVNISTPSALSPMALQCMSNLSIGNDTPGFGCHALDPKALLSPPLVPSSATNAATAMMDETLSQAEVEAVITTTVEASPSPTNLEPTGDLISAAAVAVSTDIPASVTDMALDSPPPPAFDNVQSTKPATGRVVRTKTPPSTTVDKTKNSVSPATSSSTGSAPTSTSSTSMPPPPSVPVKKQTTITKPLCPGVDACVVDNIPVYAHVWEGKGGKNILLRRLDTDFVNGTCLLSALGITPDKHAEYLQASSPWLSTHHIVKPATGTATRYSPGVVGTWIQLVEARDYARSLKLSTGNLLSNILREDLFHRFATLAGIVPDHTAAISFGLPFIARNPNGLASTASSTASSSTSSLTASSANSKSTPNLTLLSTSATSTAGTHARNASTSLAQHKGPLVRSAPATPPDGCPRPKRRRATFVGDTSPLAEVANAANAANSSGNNGNGSGNVKKPPMRTTRASVGADTPKPKVTK